MLGSCCWLSAAGQSVVLTETTISVLSGPERRALQRLALHKLQALSIQCTIPSNKGEGKNFGKRLKRSLKGRKRSITENGLLFNGGKGKTAIFGTPLDVVIKNDHISQTGVKPNPRRTRRKSEPSGISQEVKEKLSRRRRASSNTPPATATLKRQLKQNMYNNTPKKESSTTSVLRLASSSSDLNKPKRHSDGESASNIYSEQASSGWKSSRLIDALTLSSTSASASCLLKKPELPIPSPPKVPSIVLQSVDFLQTHGLHVLGIFRVPGSKKRLKQFREEFDNGFRENFSDEDNAHDVAALFKEFFRYLPEPLMTRELYSAFLSTQRFKDTKTQLEGLKYLWYLLPDSNRDTLHCLLCFLRKVASYAEDTKDENDQIIPGNKMNCRNLATLMGPNILHKVKSPHLQNFVVEDQQRAEELDEVIDVTEDLIYHHESFSAVC
ncbi:rho GTPase-activating protein 6-like isoform X2 [Xenia sp. Carnegie-2017]|uniref:rho GTPase-activating protein 6-like isoform X2 n=1 Tax=Xenia sp. Carnegie-2017 TaxID=2897299 RepID=UPI001F047B8D|nr:rho GTPase-activating protein 6-like isoform X2 [Xenia sp. Carnegie-2017]